MSWYKMLFSFTISADFVTGLAAEYSCTLKFNVISNKYSWVFFAERIDICECVCPDHSAAPCVVTVEQTILLLATV